MSRADSPLLNKMIFVVGARRSGTNWLQRILGAHPDVATVPSETYLFSRGIQPLRERFHHGVRGSTGTGSTYMDEQVLLDALRDFCDRALQPYLDAAPGSLRLVERTPEHATVLDTIGSIYPDAYVVHIVRDGRDVARSLVNQGWSTAPQSIADAAEEWRSTVEAADREGSRLQHYRVVRYEDMLADPLRNVESLYEGLGLRTSDPLVKDVLAEAQVAYNEDPANPVIASGKWKEHFTAADVEIFMKIAGETLERHGYDADAGPSRRPETAVRSQPPSRQPAWRRLGRAAGRLATPRGGRDRQVSAPALVQHNLDQLITAINRRMLQDVRGSAAPDVWIRVVDPASEWTGRGDDAWAKLADAIDHDPALNGRQIKGDVVVSVPTASAILVYETDDRHRHLRVVVVSFDANRMTRITYYRWSLEA